MAGIDQIFLHADTGISKLVRELAGRDHDIPQRP